MNNKQKIINKKGFKLHEFNLSNFKTSSLLRFCQIASNLQENNKYGRDELRKQAR